MDSNDELLQQAVSLHGSGNLQQAKLTYKKILTDDPDHGDANNFLGVLYHQLGRSEEGIVLISHAIEKFPDRFPYHLNLGVVYENIGKLQEAATAYSRALSCSPDNQDILFNLANVQKKRGDLDQAISLFEETVRIAPNHAQAHFNLGNSYLSQGRDQEAIAAFENTVANEKNFVSAWINLGDCYEKANMLTDVQRCVDHLQHIASGHPATNTLAAKLLRRTERFDEALQLLTKTVIPGDDLETSVRIHFELGKLYDRTGNANLAFDHFREANQLQLQTERVRNSTVDKNRFLNFVKENKERYRDEPLWSRGDQDLGCQETAPVFLVGFPRSGTTLLGQILDSHPRLQVMIEKPVVDKIIQNLGNEPKRYQEAVASIALEDSQELQKQYFRIADRYISRTPRSILVDQQPLNMVHLDLIEKIFPGAKIILMVRHPYDACLSCLMQHFELNDAMANLSSLKDAVVLYHEVMALWQQYERVIKPRVHMIKYEELTQQLEEELRALINFVEIEWDGRVLEHHLHSRQQQQRINTPSYHQVVEAVYSRARFRWKSYQDYFSNVGQHLDSYVEYFGYGNP